MSSDITFRAIETKDVTAVYELGEKYFVKSNERSYVYHWWNLTDIAKVVEEFPDLAFVAEMDGEIVGLVIGQPDFENIANDVGYLEWIAVDEKAQRKGVASKLVDMEIEAFKRRGLNRVVTDVKGASPASMKLFEDKYGIEKKDSVSFLGKEFAE